MGNQRRSWPNVIQAINDLESGIIGRRYLEKAGTPITAVQLALEKRWPCRTGSTGNFGRDRDDIIIFEIKDEKVIIQKTIVAGKEVYSKL